MFCSNHRMDYVTYFLNKWSTLTETQLQEGVGVDCKFAMRRTNICYVLCLKPLFFSMKPDHSLTYCCKNIMVKEMPVDVSVSKIVTAVEAYHSSTSFLIDFTCHFEYVLLKCSFKWSRLLTNTYCRFIISLLNYIPFNNFQHHHQSLQWAEESPLIWHCTVSSL